MRPFSTPNPRVNRYGVQQRQAQALRDERKPLQAEEAQGAGLRGVKPEAQQVLSTLRKGDGVCAEGAIKEFTETAGGIHSFWLLEVDRIGEINRVFDPKRVLAQAG